MYEFECKKCHAMGEFYSSIADRHKTPKCRCGGKTQLVISPVMGRVMFPAAGGQEYISPASGKAITSAKARRDDLARTGCRPYEGFQQESKEAARRVAADEKKSDEKLEASVRKAYHQLSPEKRRHLDG